MARRSGAARRRPGRPVPPGPATRRRRGGSLRSGAVRRASLLLLARGLGAEPLLLLAQLGRERLAEVLGLEHLTELDRRALALTRTGPGHALHPLDRLLLRLHLDDPEARDQLLRLGERAVGDC